jgi:hypothetical protein
MNRVRAIYLPLFGFLDCFFVGLGFGVVVFFVVLVACRVCSIKCVKVRKVIINNFDHGKKSIEEKREAYALGRNYS